MTSSRIAVVALVAACSSPQSTAPVAPPKPPAPPAPSIAPSAAPSADESASPAAPIVDAGPAFPPAPGVAPHARTLQPGDGVWTVVAPGVATTVVHPHPVKPFVYVNVVAMDRRKLDLTLVAGTVEPKSKDVPADHRPGLIPEADRARLVAVFNGGFMARHGKLGMKIGSDEFLPPQDDACTIAFGADGKLSIATFTALKPSLASIKAYRQTPPCLIEKGQMNDDLDSEYLIRKWGGAENGEKEIRRSALGLDASGQILFYGSGEWIHAKALATAMKAIGANDAAELDINYSYTKFLFYGPAGPNGPEVTSTLIPKTKYVARGYIEKASDRDFFYVTKKP